MCCIFNLHQSWQKAKIECVAYSIYDPLTWRQRSNMLHIQSSLILTIPKIECVAYSIFEWHGWWNTLNHKSIGCLRHDWLNMLNLQSIFTQEFFFARHYTLYQLMILILYESCDECFLLCTYLIWINQIRRKVCSKDNICSFSSWYSLVLLIPLWRLPYFCKFFVSNAKLKMLKP